MKSDIKCCFIGHRKIDITKELKQKLKEVIENLIVEQNVSTFLFGSRSQFNTLCQEVVNELKEKYPAIKRIAYTCRNECCIYESEKEYWEKMFLHTQQNVRLLAVDEEFEHKTKYTSNRASYVERNQAMIDGSDYCIFYYDEAYQPEKRKRSKKSNCYYQPKSGTKLAYDYARQKKKKIINVFESI